MTNTTSKSFRVGSTLHIFAVTTGDPAIEDMKEFHALVRHCKATGESMIHADGTVEFWNVNMDMDHDHQPIWSKDNETVRHTRVHVVIKDGVRTETDDGKLWRKF